MNEKLISLIANSVSFEYHDGINRHFERDFIKTTWFQLPVHVVGQVTHGYLECQLKNGDSFRADDGDVYIIPANQLHQYELFNKSNMQIVNAHVNYFLFDGIDLLQLIGCPYVIRGRASEKVTDICLHFIQLKRKPELSIQDILKRQHLALQLLMLIIEETKQETSLTQVNRIIKIQPVLEYINDNYSKALTRYELAQKMCLSEPQFHAVFKKATGQAPLAYVKALRLKKAQQLLLQKRQSIAEIAEIVGYQDQFHFSRLFKAEFGLSPQQYQKRNLQNIL